MTQAKIKMLYAGEDIEFFETEETGLYAFGIKSKNTDRDNRSNKNSSYKEIRTANGNLIYNIKNEVDKEWGLQEVKLIDGIIVVELHRDGNYFKSLKLADESGQVVDFAVNDIVGFERIDEIYRHNAEGKFERTHGLLIRAVRINSLHNNRNNNISGRIRDLYVASMTDGKLEVRHIEKMERAYGVWSLAESKEKRFAVVEGKELEDNVIFGYETKVEKGHNKLAIVGSIFKNTEITAIGDITDRYRDFAKSMKQFKSSNSVMRMFCIRIDAETDRYEDVMCVSKFNYMTFGGVRNFEEESTQITNDGQRIEFNVSSCYKDFILKVMTDGKNTKIEYECSSALMDDGDEIGNNTEIKEVVDRLCGGIEPDEDEDELQF